MNQLIKIYNIIMNKNIIIIGGGVAGMQCAISLAEMNIKSTIIEKSSKLGGKLNDWYKLFPTFTSATEVITPMKDKVIELGIDVMLNSEVVTLDPKSITLSDNTKIYADAIVISSGFDVFDAEKKEEYGYNIYENVITSVDLERMFCEGNVKGIDKGKANRIAILHCVGSRDEKVCQTHCSRVCCVAGVKQAIELKKLYPESEIFNFYMDIRMFGSGYEELYKEAQVEHNIHFVRGRISEAAQTIDNKIQIKSEDTLIGRPLKMVVDLFVLMVGMSAGKNNTEFSKSEGVNQNSSGFLAPQNIFTDSVSSHAESIFYAGSVTAPKNIGESITEGIAAANKVAKFIKS